MRPSDAIVALLAPVLLGGTCSGGGGGGAPSATVSFDLATNQLQVGVPVEVSVVVDTNGGLVQAFGLGVKAPAKKVLLHSAVAGADFDDDGHLALAPSYQIATGEIRRLVDVRHGATALSGHFEVARFTLSPIKAGANVMLEFTATSLAGPNGNDLAVTTLALPLYITQ